MRRTLLVPLLSIAAAALLIAGCGGSSGGSTGSTSSTTPQVHTAKTSLGSLLVDPSGRTLYRFAKDTGPSSTCTGECANDWPPFTAAALPKVGGGIAGGTLSLIKRSDGKRQVAVAGHPLYLYAGDQSAGQFNGQGLDAFGAKWFVVSPAGKDINGMLKASSSSSGSTTKPGYGY